MREGYERDARWVESRGKNKGSAGNDVKPGGIEGK